MSLYVIICQLMSVYPLPVVFITNRINTLTLSYIATMYNIHDADK